MSLNDFHRAYVVLTDNWIHCWMPQQDRQFSILQLASDLHTYAVYDVLVLDKVQFYPQARTAHEWCILSTSQSSARKARHASSVNVFRRFQVQVRNR
jgi:hypothetical protein